MRAFILQTESVRRKMICNIQNAIVGVIWESMSLGCRGRIDTKTWNHATECTSTLVENVCWEVISPIWSALGKENPQRFVQLSTVKESK